MSNSYAINCDFSELLSGADQKKFRFGIINELIGSRAKLNTGDIFSSKLTKSPKRIFCLLLKET